MRVKQQLSKASFKLQAEYTMTITEALAAVEQQAAITEAGDNEPGKEISLLREADLLSIVLPEQQLDFTKPHTLQLLQLLKAAGRADLSTGRIYEGHINTLYLIHTYGSAQQKERWFTEAAKEQRLFGVWNTQASNGIDIQHTGDNTFIVNGSKTFCSGAGLVSRALITGNIDSVNRKGWQMCIADMDEINKNNIDKNSWKPLGMRSSASYTIHFDRYVTDEAALLGMPGDYLQQPLFSGGAIRFAAVQLGGAEALFNKTVAYLKTLQRTEDALQSERLATMSIDLAAGDIWLRQAGFYFDKWTTNKEDNTKLITFANMTRSAIERICLNVLELSARCIGARGLMQPYDMERIVRNLTYYLRQPAPDAALLQVASFVVQSKNGIHELWD